MKRALFASAVLTLIIVVFGFAQPAFSQVTAAQAQLNGTVKDPSGSVIVKATVTLRNLDTNHVYTTTTNNDGNYILPNIPPGSYEFSAEAPGFGKAVQKDIVLRVAQVATFDISLKVAAATEIVEVKTDTPVIEPTRTEVSQVVATEQIQALPISGRLFTDFALLSPGVTTGRISLQSTFTDPTTTRISFGGQRDLSNSVTVDGADNINSATGSQRATPSQEAVSEFRVVNNSFGAEYGRALGGIVNIVTKSGTNELHGSIYEYFQNNAFDAKSILTQPGFDVFRQNQFGATLGGPISKDRTFFFLNYEGQRRGQSPTYPALLVNNLPAINALKTSLGIAPENLGVLKTADVDNGFVKVDHQFNEANRLSARYSIQDATNLNMLVGETLDGGGVGAPSSGRNGMLRDQSLVGTLTTQLSNTKVNSLLVQWARRNYGFPGVTGQPNLDVPNLILLGHNFGAFDRYNETRVQVSDTYSVVSGNHFAKFGIDTNYIQNFVIWPGFTPARVIFPSLPDLLVSSKANWGSAPCPPPLVGLVAPCLAAFFWGAPIGPGPFNPNAASPSVPTTWQNAFLPSQAQNFNVNLNHSYFGFFAQDQWKLNRKLTFNYGVRYDFETGLGNFINGYYKNFQPRFGFAYAPDSKTVIRAGYGIFTDRYNLTFFFVPAPQRPPIIAGLPMVRNQQTGTWLLNSLFLPTPCVLPGCPAPGAFLPPGTVPPPLLTSAFENLINSGSFPNNSLFAQGGTAVDRNLRSPYSEQTSLEVDRELVKGLTVSAGYLFVAGHHLVRPIDLNVGPPIGQETGTNKLLYNFAIRDPNIPAPPGGSPGTNGIFYFTDSSGNSVYHGLTLQVIEKAGKYFQLNANYTWSHTLDDGTFVTFVSTPQSNAQRNLERANSNQDARHRFVANFVADAPENTFLRNFELSSIVTLQSARPFTLFVGFDANNDGNPVTDRVGSSSRNTYRGDNLETVDLRLSRAIHLGERRKLNLAVDAFNLFNRTNVDEVFSVYGAPDFVTAVPRHFGDGIVGPSGAVGVPRTTFNPRQLQFSAKFTF
ncbi:MAG TPA: carboxypeptidase regulatory-like domain-containing protein [Candidatus Angelobacter sp.]|jgi:outer membrane receptor protein involved in Fe transport|nr:carboxypeptidase regulatory-like domain-containing protein [Candidatus Angelobacter sp.]